METSNSKVVRSFLLNWEVFEDYKALNLTRKEKKLLAETLSFEEINDLTRKTLIDGNTRRKRKWRELRHLFHIITSIKHYTFTDLEVSYFHQ